MFVSGRKYLQIIFLNFNRYTSFYNEFVRLKTILFAILTSNLFIVTILFKIDFRTVNMHN